MSGDQPHRLAVPPGFSLAQTCGPVAWAGGRWPDHDWREGALVWVGWERDRVVWRVVRQQSDDALTITGDHCPREDAAWAEHVLGLAKPVPAFADPVVRDLHARYDGLRPFANGSLAEGVIRAIVGQSISVAAAAVTESRLATRFATPIELAGRPFLPFPRLDQLADAAPALIRESGVTWRRAEAIVAAARVALAGDLPTDDAARADPDTARAALRALPLVGPWTAESALLWGLGLADAHPSGDVALLRATRRAYDRPDLDLKGLDRLAETWRPARGWAARLLWTDLLGTA